jgi:hypothetical protein
MRWPSACFALARTCEGNNMARLSPTFLFVFCLGFLVFSIAKAEDLEGAKVERTGPKQIPALDCSMNGIPGSCMLDTGAGMSYISDTPVSERLSSDETATATGIDGSIEIPIVDLSKIGLGGGIVVKNVNALRSNNYPGLPDYLGMIGGDFFLQNIKIWLFDFAENFAASTQQIISVGQNRDEILKKFPPLGRLLQINDLNRIRMQIDFSGTKMNVLFDTGAGQSALSNSFYLKHQALYKYVGTTVVTGAVASGPAITTQIFSIDKPYCFTGGVCIPTSGQVWVLPSSDDGSFVDVDMILGMDVIQQGSWYFDFGSQKYAVILKQAPTP